MMNFDYAIADIVKTENITKDAVHKRLKTKEKLGLLTEGVHFKRNRYGKGLITLTKEGYEIMCTPNPSGRRPLDF